MSFLILTLTFRFDKEAFFAVKEGRQRLIRPNVSCQLGLIIQASDHARNRLN